MDRESASKLRVRAAALAVFARRGLGGLTMRAIASEAGVTATALYRHYENRDAIVADVSEAGFVELRQRFEQPIEAGDCSERILELADRYIRWAIQNPELVELVYSYDVQMTAEARLRQPEAATFAVLTILNREIEHCMRSGRWRDQDAGLIATTLWAQARGMFSLYRTQRLPVPASAMPALFRQSMLLLINGLTT